MESKEELHNCTSMIHQSHGKILWFAKDYVDGKEIRNVEWSFLFCVWYL